MLAFLGFLTIFALLFVILGRKMSALVALIAIPALTALIGGFGAEIGTFITDGIKAIAPVAGMLLFAILFFGILTDAGMLDPIVNRILKSSAPIRPASPLALRCWRRSSTSTVPAQ